MYNVCIRGREDMRILDNRKIGVKASKRKLQFWKESFYFIPSILSLHCLSEIDHCGVDWPTTSEPALWNGLVFFTHSHSPYRIAPQWTLPFHYFTLDCITCWESFWSSSLRTPTHPWTVVTHQMYAIPGGLVVHTHRNQSKWHEFISLCENITNQNQCLGFNLDCWFYWSRIWGASQPSHLWWGVAQRE